MNNSSTRPPVPLLVPEAGPAARSTRQPRPVPSRGHQTPPPRARQLREDLLAMFREHGPEAVGAVREAAVKNATS
jgi:hypothetical protein